MVTWPNGSQSSTDPLTHRDRHAGQGPRVDQLEAIRALAAAAPECRLGRLRCPNRRELGQVEQLLGRASCSKPVGDVALVGKLGQRQEPDAPGSASQAIGDRVGVAPADVVIVRQHDDVGTVEPLGIGWCPLTSAARRAGGSKAGAGQEVGRLLALDDEDWLAGADGAQHVGKAIRDTLDALHVPMPAAAAIGSTLAEGLRLEPDYLEQQRTISIGVGVCGDLALPTGLGLFSRCQMPALLEPSHAGAVDQAAPDAEQVEHTAAFAGLVVEPGPLAEIDRHAAVGAETKLSLGRQALVRLAEQFTRNRAHGAGEFRTAIAVAGCAHLAACPSVEGAGRYGSRTAPEQEAKPGRTNDPEVRPGIELVDIKIEAAVTDPLQIAGMARASIGEFGPRCGLATPGARQALPRRGRC